MADQLRPYNPDQSHTVSGEEHNIKSVGEDENSIASTSEKRFLTPISRRPGPKPPRSHLASPSSSPDVSSAARSESLTTPLFDRAQSEGQGESNHHHATKPFTTAKSSGHKSIAEPTSCNLPLRPGPQLPGANMETVENLKSPYRDSQKVNGLTKREPTPDTLGVYSPGSLLAKSSTSPHLLPELERSMNRPVQPRLPSPPTPRMFTFRAGGSQSPSFYPVAAAASSTPKSEFSYPEPTSPQSLPISSAPATPSAGHSRSISHPTPTSDPAMPTSSLLATAECSPIPQTPWRPSADKTLSPPLLDTETKQIVNLLRLPPAIAPINKQFWDRGKVKENWKQLPRVIQQALSHSWEMPIEAVPTIINLVEILTAPMKEEKLDNSGQIYAFKVLEKSDFQGLVKIGLTNYSFQRNKQHLLCYGEVKQIFPETKDDKTTNVLHHDRVERLVHTELAPWARKVKKCPNKDKHKSHREWFSIDEAHAIAVIKKWRDWMKNIDPFVEGVQTNDGGQKAKIRQTKPDFPVDQIIKICTPMFSLSPSTGDAEDV